VAAEAVALLEAEPPGPDLVAAYARMSGVNLVLGRHRATIEWADRAMGLAAELGLDVPPRTLGFRGYARASLGDAEGLRDMRKALALAVERGDGRDAAIIHNNLAVAVMPIEGPSSAAAILREGIEFAERRGITEMADAMRAASLDSLIDMGEWDRALELAGTLGERAEAVGDAADLIQVRWVQARILARRGEFARAMDLADWLGQAARESGATEDVVAGFTAAALSYAGGGRADRAREQLVELEGTPNSRDTPVYSGYLPDLARIAVGLGDAGLAARLADDVGTVYPYAEHAVHTVRALLTEARGEMREAARLYAEAEERWERFGVIPEHAQAILGRGRCFVALGRIAEAGPQLREAREVFRRLGAQPSVAEADALLARSAAVSS
jgi:tetratricopeptide (TPR) repeat protein